jgi:RimJ/RimL family protein N-acetyltransferase
MTHPRLWDAGADDFAPAAEHFEVRVADGIRYVRVDDAARLLGIFIFVEQNRICWEIHFRVLPIAWGSRARDALRGAVEWAYQNGARRIVTSIPPSNRLAIRFAERCGFAEYGRNPNAVLKGGRLIDLVLLGHQRTPQL